MPDTIAPGTPSGLTLPPHQGGFTPSPHPVFAMQQDHYIPQDRGTLAPWTRAGSSMALAAYAHYAQRQAQRWYQ